MLGKTSLTREGNQLVPFKGSFVGSYVYDLSVFVTFVISRVVDFNVLMKFLTGSASRDPLNSSKEVRKEE